MVAHRLGQVEAYLTVREVLSGVSTSADSVLSRERSGFYRCRYATLGYTLSARELAFKWGDKHNRHTKRLLYDRMVWREIC